jgi:hypothetical protein
VDGLSVVQCYNAQISRSIFRYRNFAPEANAAVRLDLAPDRGGEHVQALLALDIWPFAQHLLLEIAGGLQVGSPILTSERSPD